MKANPSMTEEDWRWFVLWGDAKTLSAEQVESLEEQLRLDQSNVDIRVQLLSYHQHRKDDPKDSEQNCFKQVLWFIQNKPSLSPGLRIRLGTSAIKFQPKRFAILRDA